MAAELLARPMSLRRAALAIVAVVAVLGLLPAAADVPPLLIGGGHSGPQWLAGDLHVHTELGHDTCMAGDPTKRYDGTDCGLDEIYTWSFTVGERIELAKQRGLDYLAITDHNNIRSQQAAAWTVEHHLVLVPAYENSIGAHAQMLGAAQCYDGATRSTGPDCNNSVSDLAWALAERDAIREDGGAFQINHPGDIQPDDYLGDLPASGNWEAKYGHQLVPDSVEVWNIGPSYYQQPFPAATDNDHALAFWEGFLDAGEHVAATGGSDSHWRLTSGVQGVGQPTTWVFSSGRTWQEVTAGIRAGRTTISFQPPKYGGPRLVLEADADGDGAFESMLGDTVPATALLRARVGPVPANAVVRLAWSEGNRSPEIPVPPGGILTLSIPADARWVRAELLAPDGENAREATCDPVIRAKSTYCRNRLMMLALTSAMYVEQEGGA